MAEKVSSFTQLRTWQESRALATTIYKLTAKFPAEEKFGLSSQMRRAAVSVPANIAEGFSRNTAKDKAQFYSIALGSLTELLSHTFIANDLNLIAESDLKSTEKQVVEISKMINGLVKSARDRTP